MKRHGPFGLMQSKPWPFFLFGFPRLIQKPFCHTRGHHRAALFTAHSVETGASENLGRNASGDRYVLQSIAYLGPSGSVGAVPTTTLFMKAPAATAPLTLFRMPELPASESAES